MKRGGVSDNYSHLQAESFMRLAITLKVFGSVVQPHLVFLQKAVQLEASLETQQPAHLFGSKLPRFVSLQRKAFQGCPAEVSPLRSELLGDIFGEFNCDVHRTHYRRLCRVKLRFFGLDGCAELAASEAD